MESQFLPTEAGATENALVVLLHRMRRMMIAAAIAVALGGVGVLYLAYMAGKSSELGRWDSAVALFMSLLLPLAFVCFHVCCQATQKAMLDTVQQQQSLEESFHELYDKTPVMMHSIDAEGRLFSVNDFWLRTLGYRRSEVLGHYFTDYLTEEFSRQATTVNIPRFFEQGFSKDVSYQMVTSDGRVLDVLLSATAARDEMGRVVASRAMIVDLTALRHAEADRERMIQELEKKNRELERFSYRVSHDLKSPLVTIKGFLGFLEKDAQSDDLERLRGDVRRIATAADRMKDLVDALLQLSRAGQDLQVPEVVNLGELVRQTAELLSVALDQRGVEVVIEPDLPAPCCDRSQILQVLQNLVENAIKFMGEQENPRIVIGPAKAEEGMVAFFVRDNGVGLEPRNHDRIFELFQQVDEAERGSGLGLALVQRIVEVHGGDISVHSEGRGMGCTFVLTLPAAM